MMMMAAEEAASERERTNDGRKEGRHFPIFAEIDRSFAAAASFDL